VAGEIAAILESAGLEPFYAREMEPGADISEAIWQALAGSRALFVIISPDVPTHSMGMIGGHHGHAGETAAGDERGGVWRDPRIGGGVRCNCSGCLTWNFSQC